MTVKSNIVSVVARLQEQLKAFSTDNVKVKTALVKLGIMIQTETKLNIRRQGLIDTGRLLNSIQFFVEQSNTSAILRVGSYGVPYAAVHEFGFKGNVTVRAHPRHISKVFGRNVAPHETNVRSYSRRMNIKERPYLRPAVETYRSTVVDLLREAASA